MTETTPTAKIDPYVEAKLRSLGMSADVIAPDAQKTEDTGPILLPQPVSSAREMTPPKDAPPTPKIDAEVTALMEKSRKLLADNDGKIVAAQKEAVNAALVVLKDAKDAAAVNAAYGKLEEAVAAVKIEAPAPAPKAVVKKAIETMPKPAIVEPEKKIEPPAPDAEAVALDARVEALKASLDEDQQRVLEIARYAQTKGDKKALADWVEYFEKLEAHLKEHPEEEEDEQKKFIDANRPKWTSSKRARLETEMVAERTSKETEDRMRKEFEPQQRELKRIQTQPLVQAKLTDVEARLTTPQPDIKDETGKEMAVFAPEVLETIRTEGYDAAAAKYDVEAPIVQGTLTAVEAWVNVCNGVEVFNPRENAVHRWLHGFIEAEGANMLKQPATLQVIDGRKFVPLKEYGRIQREEPTKLPTVWSFSDEMISDMIANQGLLAYNASIRQREKSGWKRETKAPVVNAPETEAEKQAKAEAAEAAKGGSPRGGTKSIPGASDATGKNNALVEQLPHLRGIVAQMETKS